MKKVALLVALLLAFPTTATAAPGKVVSCKGIKTIATVKKGTELECLNGDFGVIFESIKGPAVVNFWGSWCGPCQEEMPFLVTFYKKYGKKVALIGIDTEETSPTYGEDFVKSHGITWPNLYDLDGRTKSITGPGIPVTYFINEKGKVVYKHIGVLPSYKYLENLTKKYLLK